MKKLLPRHITVLPLASLTLALLSISAAAQKIPDAPSAALPAQENAAEVAPPGEEPYAYTPALRVGDSAMGLLALQREGATSSPTPRPIAGDVARRSYERYLKSFEFPIPEHFNSTVKSKGDSGSSAR